MTGSRLGRYAETRPAPGFIEGTQVGPGPSGPEARFVKGKRGYKKIIVISDGEKS
jgi:hypothetical protein